MVVLGGWVFLMSEVPLYLEVHPRTGQLVDGIGVSRMFWPPTSRECSFRPDMWARVRVESIAMGKICTKIV